MRKFSSSCSRTIRNPVWLLPQTDMVGWCPLLCCVLLIFAGCLICFVFILFVHSCFARYFFFLGTSSLPPPCVHAPLLISNMFSSLFFSYFLFLFSLFFQIVRCAGLRMPCAWFALVFSAVGTAWPNHLAAFAMCSLSCLVVCDPRACLSTRRHRHGHWLCRV